MTETKDVNALSITLCLFATAATAQQPQPTGTAR